MSYGVYYILFLLCVATLFVLLIDLARNRAEHRDGHFRRDSKHDDEHHGAA